MRGAGERGQWADRITHTLDVEAPGEYTGRPTPSAHRCGSVCDTVRMGAVCTRVFKNPNGEPDAGIEGVLSPSLGETRYYITHS